MVRKSYNKLSKNRSLNSQSLICSYRRALCSPCNSLVRLPSKPIIIELGICEQELHTVLRSLKPEKLIKAKVIMKSSEELISLSIGGCRFFDVHSFLKTDLYSLVAAKRNGVAKEELKHHFNIFYNVYEEFTFNTILLD